MKPTGIRALLPELNGAQYKLLERYIAEQRIDELNKAFEFDGGYDQVIQEGKIVKHCSSIRFQDYHTDRIAILKKEAEL